MTSSIPSTCLIIEEDSEDLFLIERAFNQLSGITTTSVPHLDDADDLLNKQKFDLVLVSVGRATSGQLERVRNFCERNSQPSIFATVGYTETPDDELAAKCGALGVIPKESINPAVISKLIKRRDAVGDTSLGDSIKGCSKSSRIDENCSAAIESTVSIESSSEFTVSTSRQASGPKVLIVDDDDADRYLIRRQLISREAKAEVSLACDGLEAIETLLELADNGDQLPDLVLMDLNMPRKSGQEALKEIRADQRLSDLPVVILSTSINPEDKERALGNQASDFVCKPGSMTELGELLGSLIHKWL